LSVCSWLRDRQECLSDKMLVLVLYDSLANSGAAFTKVFAETAHAAAECSTGMKGPTVSHVLAKPAATVTDAQAGLFVLVPDAAMPAPAKITMHPTATTNTLIALRKGVGRVCAKLGQAGR
jgi:hypothetical protein